MFEYIGEMAKDYIYAVAPLLEDALMDRDLVHRQVCVGLAWPGLACPLNFVFCVADAVSNFAHRATKMLCRGWFF